MKIIKRWFFTFAALYFFVTSGLTFADDVELRWHANIEMDLQGYNVYCGTQSRSYDLPISVGIITNYVFADLEAGTTYFFALTAVDNAGNESGYSSEVSYTTSAPDTLTPTIAITTPTADETFSTASSVLSIGGAADDDRALQTVTWSASDGQSGTATGTNSWTIANLALSAGDTTITVTAVDAAGNQAADLLTVTRTNDLTLSVNAYKIKGKKFAGLTWSGGNSTLVDVYRDGRLIADATGTPNDGEYIHGPFSAGKPATYHVCEDGTSNCSNRVTVGW